MTPTLMPDADDDDNRYLAPLEGPDDPSVPHVTVDCSRGDCRMSFFIRRDDPRLPDGPFLCADHDDVPTKFKVADHVEMTVICDRCGTSLVAVGQSREAAREKLRVQIHEHQWLVVDRLEGAMDAAASLTGQASSTIFGAQDLCGACRKAL